MLLMIGGVSGCRERRVGGPVSLTGGGRSASDPCDLTDADDLTDAEAALHVDARPRPRRDEPCGWIREDASLRPRRRCQVRPRSSSRISPSFRYAARWPASIQTWRRASGRRAINRSAAESGQFRSSSLCHQVMFRPAFVASKSLQSPSSANDPSSQPSTPGRRASLMFRANADCHAGSHMIS